jgi:hypothetical protein
MGRDAAKQPTPDLLSTATGRDALAPPKMPATETAPQRYVLLKDLPNAVKHLTDGELDMMHAAILEEMKRRGRIPPGVETGWQSPRRRFDVRPNLTNIQSPPIKKRRNVDIAEVPLTQGKLNAVRAAFRAGVTPSRIAKQFGISQSNVRKVLASDEPKR